MATLDAHSPGTHPAPEFGDQLQRNLSNRHVQLIAIGGAIGTGLFMGSGKTIHAAGPSILLVYLTVGVMLFFVMRAMGAGYWNFWVNPDHPTEMRPLSLVLAVVMLGFLLFLNLLTVRLFGEMEFWFAIIKVIAIVALIIMGIWMLVTVFTSPDGTKASITYLWDRGGFFPKGLDGFGAGFQIAVFAFVGIELVGTTAAETKDPTTTLPRAINSIPVRIIVFYVLALLVIMTVTPWDKIDAGQSPFVNLFSLAGLAAAATVMNFVVLTSASSSCNSGLFSTSRMLYGLSHKGMAPRAFGRLSRHKVPQNGLFVSVLLVATSILLMLDDSVMGAFTVVTTISAVLFIFVWGLILLSYIVYLRRHPEAHARSVYKMPGAHFMPYVVLAFFAVVLVLLTQEKDTLQALLVTPVWFVILVGAWFAVRNRVHHDSSTTELVD